MVVVCHGVFMRVLFGEPTGRMAGRLADIFEEGPGAHGGVVLPGGVGNCQPHEVVLHFPPHLKSAGAGI